MNPEVQCALAGLVEAMPQIAELVEAQEDQAEASQAVDAALDNCVHRYAALVELVGLKSVLWEDALLRASTH